MLALPGCAEAFHRRAVPAPAGAVAIASLSDHRVAVLAGTDSAKAVSLIDLRNGTVLETFGVTREATGISAETPDGPILLAVGERAAGGGSIGAVEVWSLTGMKEQVVPLPAAALGITRVEDGELFALSGADTSRVAIQVSLPSLQVGKAIPLEAGSDGLSLCKFGASLMLVYSDAVGNIDVRAVDSGQEQRSSVVGQSPTCLDGDSRVYAISKAPMSRSVLELSVPDMQQIGAIAAPNDAASLYPAVEQGLLVLDEAADASNIQKLDNALLNPPTAQP